MASASENIAFDGHCAFAVSAGKLNIPGGDSHSIVVDGKTYLFSNPIAKILFKLLPNRLNKAESNWSKK